MIFAIVPASLYRFLKMVVHFVGWGVGAGFVHEHPVLCCLYCGSGIVWM